MGSSYKQRLAQSQAYKWANTHLPHPAILQHNPARAPRIFDFGLYSRNRVALADEAANLFGVTAAMAKARMNAIRPIFERRLTPQQVFHIADANHIDYLFFLDIDPVWQKEGGSPPTLDCLHRNSRVCIVEVAAIGKGPIH